MVNLHHVCVSGGTGTLARSIVENVAASRHCRVGGMRCGAAGLRWNGSGVYSESFHSRCQRFILVEFPHSSVGARGLL